MFWWRSMHRSEWTPVQIAAWTSEYDGLGKFLEDFPEFKELFGAIVQEPSPIMRSLKKISED
jgi:hypothetical protein